MKLEQQVSNRELSQRLNELGVKQESVFWWTKDDLGATYLITGEMLPVLQARYARTPHQSMPEDYGWRECVELYSAFTVAELGEMLPLMFEFEGFTVSWECTKMLKKWKVFIENGNYKRMGEEFVADTEADARAKMLVYLLENNLITFKENK